MNRIGIEYFGFIVYTLFAVLIDGKEKSSCFGLLS